MKGVREPVCSRQHHNDGVVFHGGSDRPHESASRTPLPIEVENPNRTQVYQMVRTLAGQYQLTAYDAAYLELSVRHKLPIASLDRALSRAALAAGLSTVQA